MKLPIEWLSTFVRLSDKDRADLVRRLPEIGIEVAGSTDSLYGDVLEVEITANRGDLLSVFGMAREISAATGKTLTAPRSRKIRTAIGSTCCGSLMQWKNWAL